MIPGFGKVAIPYPSTVKDEDSPLAVDEMTDDEFLRWLSGIDADAVDESDYWIPVVYPLSPSWNTVDTSGILYGSKIDVTRDFPIEQTVDRAAEMAAEIIGILMTLLDISFDEAAELLEQLLQYRDLDQSLRLIVAVSIAVGTVF